MADPLITHIHQPLDWKQAIHWMVDPFFQNGLTTIEYEKSIMDQFEQHGPYCILRPGMALIHGPVSDQIQATGVHIAVCDTPVFFDGCQEAVYFLIGLCAPDKEQYLKLITILAPLLRRCYTAAYLSSLSDSQLLEHFAPLKPLLTDLNGCLHPLNP